LKENIGFRDLTAWQKADDLASAVFRACRDLPPSLRWLSDKAKLCAVSVPANIAEGHGRGSAAELLRFLDTARGSLSELEYYLHFLGKESLLSSATLEELEAKRAETAAVVLGLWRSLKGLTRSEWDNTGRIREDQSIYHVN
jgi:four helix bundle protein